MAYINPASKLTKVPEWEEYIVTFNDVNVASGSETVVVGELPARAGVQQVRMHLTESFAGGGADCEMDVGYGTATNAWVNAQSITFSPSPTAISHTTFINNGLRNMQDPTDLVVTIRNTTGDLDVLTGGAISVFFLISSV
jgi:hypothetical protein